MTRTLHRLAAIGCILGAFAGRADAKVADYADEARRLTRLMACSREGDGALGSQDRRREVRHCRRLLRLLARFDRRWVRRVERFMAREVRQAAVPKRVVYPFGGSDLLTALLVYPRAEEITVIALERAGDPRPIRELRGRRLGRALDQLHKRLRRYTRLAYSTSVGLEDVSRRALTAQLTFNLLALHLRGYEPLSLRYFRLGSDGTPIYITEAEVAASDRLPRRLRRPRGKQARVFANLELRFRKKGGGRVKVFRHIAANLADAYVERRPALQVYLARRPRVSALVKAGSYLLWRTMFSWIRGYLLSAAQIIVSDSSGIPPCWAKPAGFVQRTFGRYKGAYFVRIKTHREAIKSMRALWREQPRRKLGFRFGYPDRTKRHNHLLISVRAPSSQHRPKR